MITRQSVLKLQEGLLGLLQLYLDGIWGRPATGCYHFQWSAWWCYNVMTDLQMCTGYVAARWVQKECSWRPAYLTMFAIPWCIYKPHTKRFGPMYTQDIQYFECKWQLYVLWASLVWLVINILLYNLWVSLSMSSVRVCVCMRSSQWSETSVIPFL